MVDSVKVVATYERSNLIPRIGQRKKMRVNGRAQFLTLNRLEVERREAWDEEREVFIYEFDAKETWGNYAIG